MIMNYNEWFNKYHRYLTGTRDGLKTYNDTKWNTVKERYQTLIDLNSQLIDQQPFGVAGNYTGFQELLELINHSNYTFEDLNRSLIETYQMSLQNAMSKMLVNTHAVVASVKYGDKKNISINKYGNYVIDVPYAQLHFGDRDEFIRQQLHRMYETENQYYVPADDFFSDEIQKILGFTLICCVNGYMVSNWSVGIDEKGFRFQIPWKSTADPNFIIYKLDCSRVIIGKDIPMDMIENRRVIPFSYFTNANMANWIGCHCIVEVSDTNTGKNAQLVPNFGIIRDTGLEIINIQNRTLHDLQYQAASTVKVRAYIVKYLHEIRDVYPAFNYYDMMGTRIAYDKEYRHITNDDGNLIHLQNGEASEIYDICTPPISIDRQTKESYTTLIDACTAIDELTKSTQPATVTLDKNCRSTRPTTAWIAKNIIAVAKRIYGDLKSSQAAYIKCAILTSMISQDKLQLFESTVQTFKLMADLDPNTATVVDVQRVMPGELYSDLFTQFIRECGSPLQKEPFTTLTKLANYTPNYFVDDIPDGTERFNRPISEQCFIALEYIRDEQCWVFATPTIKHMNGIGNTFYVDDKLRGYEVYKFFFLYTDTENPGEQTTDALTYEETIDFDLFSEEVKRHFGYVRYWNIESRLTKLSRMLYQYEDNETKVNVLSKILKRKIDDPTFMEYPTDMNFELSNVTSDHLTGGETDLRAPFSLNFLFYTISMMYNSKDELLTYLVQSIVDKKFHPRYSDLKLSKLISESELGFMTPINYSKVYDKDLGSDVYNYVFEEAPEGTYYSGSDDGQIATYVSLFLSDFLNKLSVLQAYYKTEWNQERQIQSMLDLMTRYADKISQYVDSRGEEFNPLYPETIGIVEAFSTVTELGLYTDLTNLKTLTHAMCDNGSTKLYPMISKILMMLQKVYDLTGFDHDATRRLRRLYLQMKQLDTSMGLPDFHDWAETFDMEAYRELPDSYEDVPDVMYTKSMFAQYTNTLEAYLTTIQTNTEALMTEMNDTFLSPTVTDMFLKECVDFLVMMKDNVFDQYVIDQIQTSDVVCNTEPSEAYFELSRRSDHLLYPPLESDTPNTTCKIMLKPVYEQTATGYNIKYFVPDHVFAFFDGTSVTANIVVTDESAQTITTVQNVTITFQKVARSIDTLPTFQQFTPGHTIPLSSLNVHETFDVDDDDIINQKHADLNYEILAGNRFIPLHHFSEYTMGEFGPYDRFYIPCDQLNVAAISDREYQDTAMWFKPCQVWHPPVIGDPSYYSFGGKYRVGETIYAATNDGLSVFPLKLRAITHGESKGFLEAVVDEENAKWFRTTDTTVMDTYLTTDVECHIIDDNFRNFMDEFSSDGSIPENLSEMFETKAHLIYIGSAQMMTDDRDITINMLNHNFNPYTNQELYRILRAEPDDHSVWDEERRVFNEKIEEAKRKGTGYANEIRNLAYEKSMATTREERIRIQIQIDDVHLKMDYQLAYIARLELYLEELEKPTTWYNIFAYDDALVYINNGRAHLSRTYQPQIRDLSYTDDVKVRLYDWETKSWINQNDYTVTPTVETIDDEDTMTTLTITFSDASYEAKKLLVYFMYEDSEAFDSIPVNDAVLFNVHFRPVFSSKTFAVSEQPYDNIRIRKHFDANETYPIKALDDAPDEFNATGYLVKRVDRSGKYTNGSTLRICHLTVQDGNQTYDASDFDLFVKHPFQNTTVPQKTTTKQYQTTISVTPDGFEEGHQITLVCVQNDVPKFFDGTMSNIMFHGVTTSNSITIDSDTLPINVEPGRYICTVKPDTSHPISGGVITIDLSLVSHTDDSPATDWIRIPADAPYRILPNEFVMIPHSGITLSDQSVLIMKNQYELDTSATVSEDNDNVNDPFTYYYDQLHRVRYPIANMQKQDISKRLVIDDSENPTVQTIKSNYISISRYVAQEIPADGIIDLTGYIPTPLSRSRYEIWVNGRYVSDPDHLIILSPTAFQLRNMTSLRNLEVIELVDDIEDSLVLPKGTVYVDINGLMYTNYQLAILRNANIVNQSIQYQLGVATKSGLDTYLPDAIRYPNNVDIETDIMTFIQQDNPTSYDELTHIPSINGEKIKHMTSYDIGFREIPTIKILQELDRTWKRERFSGEVSLIHSTDRYRLDQQTQNIHVYPSNDGYIVYTTGINSYRYTLYISELENGEIDDTTNTVKIIPMIPSGTVVKLDSSYQGKWIHSTIKNTKPIQI